MKILVTGANGFVGTHLCEKLLHEGHMVFALVRNPPKFKSIEHDSLVVIQGDLSEENLSWVEKLPNDLDTCVHTAGIVHSYLTDEFFRVNADGTEFLVNSLKKKFQNLHFVLISSLAAAGPSVGVNKRNEDDMDLPISIYGRSKKKAEEVLKRHAPKNYTLSVIRPPMVIGPGDAAVLDIFKMVQSGVVLLPGSNSKTKLYSFVCVFDLVETIIRVVSTKPMALFYSAHPQVVSFNELIMEIKAQLNKKWMFYIPMPLIFVKLLSHLLDFFYRLFPHSLRLTPDKYHELKAINWTCDGKKSEAVLGQTYNYDLKRTVTVTLLDYRARKWI